MLAAQLTATLQRRWRRCCRSESQAKNRNRNQKRQLHHKQKGRNDVFKLVPPTDYPPLYTHTPHSVRKLSTEQRVVRKKSAQFWRSQHLSEDCLEQRLEGAERKREDGEASSCKDQGVVGCSKGGRLKEEKSTTWNWVESSNWKLLLLLLLPASASAHFSRDFLFIFASATSRFHLLLLFGAQQPPKDVLEFRLWLKRN